MRVRYEISIDSFKHPHIRPFGIRINEKVHVSKLYFISFFYMCESPFSRWEVQSNDDIRNFYR